MIYVIIVLLLLGMLVAMAFIFKAMPVLWLFLLASIIVTIIGCVMIKKAGKSDFNTAETEELRKAQEMDRIARNNNLRIRKSYKKDVEETKKKLSGKYQPYIDSIDKDVQKLRAEEFEVDNKINTGILLGEDRNETVINFVLNKMETGRADSLKEALQMYDEESRRQLKDFLEAQQRRWDAQDRAKEAEEREQSEREHRWRMEEMERKRLNEVEKSRKLLEELNDKTR